MKGGLAIFGTVLTDESFEKWVTDLVDAAVRGGEIAPDEAETYRTKLLSTQRGAIPMVVSQNTADDQALTPERMIPAEWNGKFTEHKWLIDPDDKMKLSFTHIVCFAGGEQKKTPWPLWFDGKPIYHDFGLCTWDDKTQSYNHIHCINCAQTIIGWIISKQVTWKRAADPAAPKASTHEAPARLQ